MDIEKVTHGTFRLNIFTVLLVSGVVVGLAASLGRGILNIQGSLVTEQPTDLTVVRLLEPYELFPSEVYALPKRDDGEYRYSIRMKNGDMYFVRIKEEGPPWELAARPEFLRESE